LIVSNWRVNFGSHSCCGNRKAHASVQRMFKVYAGDETVCEAIHFIFSDLWRTYCKRQSGNPAVRQRII